MTEILLEKPPAQTYRIILETTGPQKTKITGRDHVWRNHQPKQKLSFLWNKKCHRPTPLGPPNRNKSTARTHSGTLGETTDPFQWEVTKIPTGSSQQLDQSMIQDSFLHQQKKTGKEKTKNVQLSAARWFRKRGNFCKGGGGLQKNPVLVHTRFSASIWAGGCSDGCRLGRSRGGFGLGRWFS